MLFEDVPGRRVKLPSPTRWLRRSAWASVASSSHRTCCPSDVLGVSIYNPQTTSFEIRKGPIFTNVVVADEINRAPPRTQSGLLEAMQDGSVTIDDQTFSLPRPFLVMATQNPLEHHGTYPLPESQLDRFLMRITIGYPDGEAERRILAESASTRAGCRPTRRVLSPEQVVQLQNRVEEVDVDQASSTI